VSCETLRQHSTKRSRHFQNSVEPPGHVKLLCGVGLERLQQLMDAMTDEGVVIRQHIYRVTDATDANMTVYRHHRDETSKHILIDLPTAECEQFLKLQVGRRNHARLYS